MPCTMVLTLLTSKLRVHVSTHRSPPPPPPRATTPVYQQTVEHEREKGKHIQICPHRQETQKMPAKEKRSTNKHAATKRTLGWHFSERSTGGSYRSNKQWTCIRPTVFNLKTLLVVVLRMHSTEINNPLWFPCTVPICNMYNNDIRN